MADDLDLVTAGLPLVEFEGPETSDLGVAGAQFDQDTVENNYWWAYERERESQKYRLYSDVSRAVYGDPDAWQSADVTMPDPAQSPLGVSFAADRERARADAMFQLLGERSAIDPGRYANLTRSVAELENAAEVYAREELNEQRNDALGRLANRSDPNWIGGAASFAGSMAAGVLDVEGVALLPFGAGSGSLARTMLVESLLGAAGAAVQVPAQQKQGARLGYEAPDPVLQILGGAAFGAALPVAGRALRLGVNTLTPAGRVENRDLLRLSRRPGATDTERGAGTTLARDQATLDTAPQGGDELDHAGRIDQAEAELMGDGPQMVRAGDVIPDEASAPAAPGVPPQFDFEPGGNAARDANQVGYVFGKLLGLGATPKEAASLLGNLMQESGRGLNTGAIGDGGNSIGMGQWNGPRRRALMRFADARGVDWRDLDLQVEFLWRELHGSERAAWEKIKAAPDAATGARIASAEFWRPGVPHLSNRMAFARMVSSQYDGGQVPHGGAPGRWRDPGDDVQAAGVYSFDPRDVQVDATAYQFKMGGDQFGVTDRLQGERVWDPSAAIGVIVHERLDGTRYIADGHQRMGLARRMMDRGHDPITLQGFLYRETDGFGVEEVRALAALRNIRQESGSPLDAAKIMRDHPELVSQMGSRSRPFMMQASALADLAPGPFQAIVNDVIPQNWGAIVGRIIPDDDRMQGVAIAAVKRANPANETQAESIIRDIRRLGLERAADDAQMDLFGDGFDLRQTVISERARVIDRVMKDARTDRAIFGKLEREAAAIEEAGNVLDREANLSRAEQAEQTLGRLLILADQPGPVRDAIDAAARALRAGSSIDDAARQVADAIGSPGGRVDAPGADRGGHASAPLTEVLKDVPPRRYVGRLAEQQPFDDLDQLYARAPLAQERLAAEGSMIAADIEGVTWKTPGLKAREATAEKIARKGYASPRSLTDTSRGGFVVTEPGQADDVVARLAAVFDIVDEGWKRQPVGYIDRKVIVRHPDGMLSEVQIWTADMLAAKDLGTPIYTQRRSLPDGPARDALFAREIEIYSAAAAGMKDFRFASDGTSASPMLHPNSRRSTASSGASDRTPAETDTSSASTGTQGAPGSSWASANNPPGVLNRAAGRPSQSQYDNSFMGNVPLSDTSNMRAVPPSVNDLPPVGDAQIQRGLFDDPLTDPIEAARLDRLGRDVAARLSDPTFDLDLPLGRADGDQPPQTLSLRETLADLDEEDGFARDIETICNLKGPRT